MEALRSARRCNPTPSGSNSPISCRAPALHATAQCCAQTAKSRTRHTRSSSSEGVRICFRPDICNPIRSQATTHRRENPLDPPPASDLDTGRSLPPIPPHDTLHYNVSRAPRRLVLLGISDSATQPTRAAAALSPNHRSISKQSPLSRRSFTPIPRSGLREGGPPSRPLSPFPIRVHPCASVARPSCSSCPEFVLSEVHPDSEVGVEGW